MEAATQPEKKSHISHKETPPAKIQPPPASSSITIPINGKVTAQLKGVSIDTVMDIVGRGPLQRLGFDGRLNGPATATWKNGDVATLVVEGKLQVSAPVHAVTGEAPTSGIIDATYTQRNGAVELRALDLAMPSSHVAAQGHLGAYPLTSPTSIAVEVHSHDLDDFDTLFEDLGLTHEGRTGTAALPTDLDGQADFHGTWTGSILDPHLAGQLSASDLAVELPARPGDPSGKPQSVYWDKLEASGSYSAARISIDHSQLTHGGSTIALEGALTAAAPATQRAVPNFDGKSTLRMHLNASKVSASELLPFLGENVPVAGDLNAQIDADGMIDALDGSGWVELEHGVVYGEPIAKLHAQGKVVGRVVQLASVTVNDQAGKLNASGSYDMRSRQFQINAQGAGIDVSKIHRLQDAGVTLAGQLGFTINGSGTFDDPHLQAQGTLTGLTLSDEPVGSVQIAAHTANHSLIYDLTTKFESATLSAHGETVLDPDYTTQAKLEFSEFNIAGLLKLAHIPGLSGESALAGTLTLQGPLAHTDQMRGDAHIQDLAFDAGRRPPAQRRPLARQRWPTDEWPSTPFISPANRPTSTRRVVSI